MTNRKRGHFRYLGIITIILILISLSCSQIKKQPDITKKESYTESKKKIIKNDKNRIVGSSSINGREDSTKKKFFLYGAEQLNLDNYYFDIPVVYNDSVKMWIKYFLNKGRGFFERYSARAGRYAPILGSILEENGLPRDFIFLAMAESGFQNNAKSWAKAVGPWQFMPYTGRRYGLKINWYVDERRDPIKATIAAGQYLKKLYNDFGTWEIAAAAYNAGEGKMARAIKRYKTENFWRIRKGRYLKNETKNYIPKIMALAIIGKNLKSFGFEDIDFHDPLDFDEIRVPSMTDLILLSKDIGVKYQEIRKLNPEVLRWFSPPNEEYLLRVPVGIAKVWNKRSATRNLTASKFQPYYVKGKSATLKSIARKFKIKPYVLKLLNKYSIKSRLKRKTKVLLPFRIGQSRRNKMYADLYEKPRRSVVRRRRYKSRVRIATRKGRLIASPSEFYTVKRGDTLWSVAQKKGISLNTLIRSNLRLVKNRMIREGDKLIVR